MSTKVFLSGAIEGVEKYGVEWRKSASKTLNLLGYEILDPTLNADSSYETPEEIVQKNLYLQKRADIILVEYMIQDRQYIGTDFEMAWAKLSGQPIVVFTLSEPAKRVYLKYMATRITYSMQDAIEYIAINYPSN